MERGQAIEPGRLDSHYARDQKPPIRYRAAVAEFFRIRPADVSRRGTATHRICNGWTTVDAYRRGDHLRTAPSNAILPRSRQGSSGDKGEFKRRTPEFDEYGGPSVQFSLLPSTRSNHRRPTSGQETARRRRVSV